MIHKYQFLIVAVIFLAIASIGYAQVLEHNTLTQERKYELVPYVYGPKFETIKDKSVDSLYVFAYHEGSGWEPIPFQIDESDTAVFDPPNGRFDEKDEILFLAQDAGDKVSNSTWIDDASSKQYGRWELQVIDWETNEAGWVYLFYSTTLTEAAKSTKTYINYNPEDDEIHGTYYSLKYGDKWYPEDISITEAGGGNNKDFYDRMKMRISVNTGVFALVAEEDYLVKQEEIKYTPNPVVRLRRKLTFKVVIPGIGEYGSGGTVTIHHHPYATISTGRFDILELLGGYPVKAMRMSFDLNSEALSSGMMFYSGDSSDILNSTIPIDGAKDASQTNRQLTKNKPNWMLATSAGNGVGTLLTFNDVFFELDPSLEDDYTQSLYYWDNAATTGTTFDDFQGDYDTGDNVSYGDHGVYLSSYLLLGLLDYKITQYFLPANQPVETAQAMFQNFLNYIGTNVYQQEFVVGISDNNKTTPDEFALHPNYPNPFNPATTISFALPRQEHAILNIYNIRGMLITTLADETLESGVHRYAWNGRDKQGHRMSSGIYICSLETESFHASHKMILTK